MADPRLQKLAHVLVHHSLEIKPDDKFMLISPAIAAPLVTEIYREAIRAGAHVTPVLNMEHFQEIFLQEANPEQLSRPSEYMSFCYNHFDVIFMIIAEENTKGLSSIDPQRIGMFQAAKAPLSHRMLERAASGELRWGLTLYPTQAHAMDAGMSLADYEDFVYKAGLLDLDDPIAAWNKIQEEQQRVVDFLSAHNEIHIVAPGTDLTYHVGGRTWISCYGKENFPDGEVFTGPIEDSVNGHVHFTFPAVYQGNEVENVRLTFKDGKVVESSAGKGENFLNAMLDLDEGARFLGEVAFGLNYSIQRFTKNTLFDEKLGGTMHMALGASYPETGGKNTSGLHWDMVCDLHDGKVYADGKLCYENGQFLI